MDPLPMAPSCALDEDGLRRQLARYRRAGEGARLVERSSRRLVVDLGAQVDPELVGETIAIERACCPFFTLDWEVDRRRLTIAVSEAEHTPALEAIAFALDLHDSSSREPAAVDSATEPVFVDNTKQSRFEVRVGDELAGFVQYRRRGGLVALVHTEIDERYEGRGLASRLIAHALDAARAEGLAVLPFCPFVRDYIDKHREYLDLVPLAQRDRFNLPANT